MPWTPPKTNFSPGNVLTAAQMNAIGENLLVTRNLQLNVVSTTKTDTETFSLTANSFSANVTGLTATITPSTNTSKVLVIATVSASGESGLVQGAIRLMRNTTAIGIGATAGSRVLISSAIAGYDQSNIAPTISLSFLDSPATTSAVVYAIQLRNMSGLTRSHYVNRGYTDTDNSSHGRQISTITALEIPV